MAELGFRVILFDLRGHGGRELSIDQSWWLKKAYLDGGGDAGAVSDCVLQQEASDWSHTEHARTCQESCYECLKTYENQYFHGLLDWRLALAYLRAIVQPKWSCGLDGDFRWGPLQDWPQQAQPLRVPERRV